MSPDLLADSASTWSDHQDDQPTVEGSARTPAEMMAQTGASATRG